MRKWMFGIGLCLIALALVFLYLVFPMLTKMPADYEQEYTFEGSVQIYASDLGMLVPIDTKMTRALEATGVTEDDVVLIKQDITFFEKNTGAPLSAINPALAALDSSEVYGVDRSTRANVPGEGDTSRTGQFTFPADVQQQTYNYWSSSSRSALPATFKGEQVFHDLDTYVFEINSTDNAYLPDVATGLPRTLDVYAKLIVEPLSGIPVYALTRTTINLEHPLAGTMPVLINESEYSDTTIDEMVEMAKSNANLITWVSVYGFWGVIVIGAFLVIFGLLKFKS